MDGVCCTTLGRIFDFWSISGPILLSREAEIIFKSMAIGTLSPGKAFGAAQMMNIHSRYHATLKDEEHLPHTVDLLAHDERLNHFSC